MSRRHFSCLRCSSFDSWFSTGATSVVPVAHAADASVACGCGDGVISGGGEIGCGDDVISGGDEVAAVVV